MRNPQAASQAAQAIQNIELSDCNGIIPIGGHTLSAYASHQKAMQALYTKQTIIAHHLLPTSLEEASEVPRDTSLNLLVMRALLASNCSP